jgi:HEAT repeat protein
MPNMQNRAFGVKVLSALGFMLAVFVCTSGLHPAHGQYDQLTPLQFSIRQQQERLSSADSEERRDAIMQLGLLRHVEASRAAVPGLSDDAIAVRVAAATAVLSLPGDESAALLIPLLKDKNEFVRQEIAYALGKTGSRATVAPLIEMLGREKGPGARGAAVVSLGRLGDDAAAPPLVQILSGGPDGKKREQNPFVLRAAARGLGQLRSRVAVPTLVALIENPKIEADIKREAAAALGDIGDPAAAPALRSALASPDPYLSMAAEKSLRSISPR